MFSSEHLAAILAALPDLVFVLTRSGRYAEVFGGADLRYYHDASGLVGQAISDVMHEDKATWFLAEIGRVVDEGGMHIVEYSLALADVRGLESGASTEPIWFEGRIQKLGFPVLGEDAVLWVASNVTERHALEARLRAQSETDELTGLWNRRHFEKLAVAEMHRAQRYAHPVSVLIFDIDHFKIINDTCGHQIGDEVLIELAQLVRSCIRDSDSLTRWGGEEFTILMPDSSLEIAGQAAEKIRRTVAEHRFKHGLKVSLSIGVADWEGEGESLHALISRADDALYTAKHAGRNRCVLARSDDFQRFQVLTSASQTLRWRKQYESGDAMIDAEHRELFERAGALQQAISAHTGDADPLLLGKIDALLEDISCHFSAEEALLAERGWPELSEHRAEHRQLLARAGELRSALDSPDIVDALHKIVRFIAVEVVVNHTLRADRLFFPVLAAPLLRA